MPKSSTLVIRLLPEDRAALKIAAGSVPLSEWARAQLVKQARREPAGVRLSEAFVRAVAREAEEQMEKRYSEDAGTVFAYNPLNGIPR